MEIIDTGQIWMSKEEATKMINGDIFGLKLTIWVRGDGSITQKRVPFNVEERAPELISGTVIIDNVYKTMTLRPIVLLPSVVFEYRLSGAKGSGWQWRHRDES